MYKTPLTMDGPIIIGYVSYGWAHGSKCIHMSAINGWAHNYIYMSTATNGWAHRVVYMSSTNNEWAHGTIYIEISLLTDGPMGMYI